MTTWRDSRFAVVDLETTGLDAAVHEVLSVGIVEVIDGRIPVGTAYYREIRPRALPEADNVVIHGIRPSVAAAAGDPDTVGREVIERLREHVIVAHVAWVERAFLAAWLGPLGWRTPKEVVDTDVLARQLIVRAGGPRVEGHLRLGAAASVLGVPEQRRHHALGDALTTAQVFLACATTYDGGTASVRTLARARPPA